MTLSWLKTHPSVWTTGTLDRDGLYNAARQLQSHEKFEEARYAYSYAISKSLSEQRSLQQRSLLKIMRGDAQFALLAIVMHLHSKRDLGKPDSGVTVQRILELFARGAAHGSHCELASPTRIKAMIALLRYGQALIPGGQAGDMRCRPLVPTAKLIAPFRNWLSAFLQTVNIVLPLPEGALSAPEALLAEVMSYNVYAYIYSGFTLHESFTSVQNCMSREAGHTIFMALIAGLSSLEDGQVVSHTPIDELSLRLNISRGTVRNVLNDFKRDGHIQFDRGGHRVVISQAFKNICNQWVALELLWVYAFVTLAWQCL